MSTEEAAGDLVAGGVLVALTAPPIFCLAYAHATHEADEPFFAGFASLVLLPAATRVVQAFAR